MLIAIVVSFLIFLGLDGLMPLPEAKTYSTQVYDRDDNLLAAYLSEDDKWRFRTPTEEVADDFKRAILAKEDQYFYYHPGVNPVSIIRAAWSNLWSGKRVSGASTITMQVARMLEPKPRTLGNKLYEMFRALQLEWHHSKDEILEMYLSYLPYGGNVEGVKAASYIYFGRPPQALSLAQATLLTVIPNRPNSLRLDTRRQEARSARDQWLRYFETEEIFSPEEVAVALGEPITATRRNLVPKAPQFSRKVSKQRRLREDGNPEVVQSSLDLDIQMTVERLLDNHVRRARAKGISNGAVLVVDNTTSEVLAYCGSADFFDDDAAGQVDGVGAIRSPGSTLKPVAYGMAFDKGIMTPDTRLLDIPQTWNGYAPRNFDETFRGPVSMAYALRNSLNTTAVHTLNTIGFDDFMDLMELAGMESLKSQRPELGLSVILGGCGVTLEEMVRLFSTFANQGRIRPLQYQKINGDIPKGLPLFSEGAAWMIWKILSSIQRPDLPNDVVAATNRAKIAWKTGTSYGRRDAWSIGFTPRYTVGVWIGNFDGKGVPDLTGASMAVPLLFEVFGTLEKGKTPLEFPQPASVDYREVCSETGDVPSIHCGHTQEGFYLTQRSKRTECEQEQMLYVNTDSTLQFCTGCLPREAYLKASYPVLPAALCLWYEENGIRYPKPPLHNPACEATFDGPGPEIMSPLVDYEYLVEEGAGQEILLQAGVDTRTNRNYWYANGEFFRSAAPGEKVFYPAKQGKLTVTCMDDRGRSSKVEVVVKEY